MLKDTICAPATPQGIGALGIVRISGPMAIAAITALLSDDKKAMAIQHSSGYTLHFARLCDKDGLALDEAIISIFKNPHSYTGEDLVEVSIHGSPYIMSSILDSICADGKVRLAQPGEFTKRAFLNGKLDLSQAEAVGDLIASQTSVQHQNALKQLGGGLSNSLKELRARLLHFAALLELELDFGEEDVTFADRDTLLALLDKVDAHATKLISTFRSGNALKEGIKVVIVGRPNAGKSTLLNALLEDDRALVSPIAGTTRDTVEEGWTYNGIRYRLIDTAGLRPHEEADEVEQMGMARTRQALEKADICIYLFDITQTQVPDVLSELSQFPVTLPVLPVANKVDLHQVQDQVALKDIPNVQIISAKAGYGLQDLKDAIAHLSGSNHLILQSGDIMITQHRHLEALQGLKDAAQDAQRAVNASLSGELVAFHLRESLNAIGLITGEVLADEILGEVFGNFCIGK